MCGRSSITKTEKQLEKRFERSFYSDDLERYNPIPNFNIAPTAFVPIITEQVSTFFKFAHWGLIPSWSKDKSLSSSMINARIESIQEKKSFKNLISRQRCLVPIDGYYEWKKLNSKISIPHYVRFHNHELFTVAGLWDQWLDKENNILQSFTMITQEAPSFMQDLHHRIPAILLVEQEKDWLNSDISELEALSMIQPIKEGLLFYYPISKKVNKVINNDLSLLEEVEYNDPGKQMTLF